MAIKHIITRGYGNGTFSGAIKEVVTRGYILDSEFIDPAHAGRGAGSRHGPTQRKRQNRIFRRGR